MLTRINTIRILALIAIPVLCLGCGRKSSWKDSGIPKTLTNDALLHTAGAPQGVTFPSGSSGGMWTDYAVSSDRDFQVSVSSGTPGQLLAAFRSEVRRKIEGAGAKIHSTGVSEASGSATDLRGFDYGYSWGGNAGIVRVKSVVGINGQVELSLFCYEHQR